MADVIREGRVAQRILDDDVFQKAVRMAEEQTIEKWKQAETTEEREDLHARIAAIDAVESQLRTLVSRAEVEEQNT